MSGLWSVSLLSNEYMLMSPVSIRSNSSNYN